MKCEFCGENHDGSYGSGRFCSVRCSRKFSTKNVDRTALSKRVSETLLEKNLSKKKDYLCEKCGVSFKKGAWRKGRKIHCDSCKRKVIRKKRDATSILELSKRTISKIVSRLGGVCSVCKWGEAPCDIHHIIPSGKGGSDNHDNLIILCPNCHRVAHSTGKFSTEFLQERSIDKVFPNWKDFYKN